MKKMNVHHSSLHGHINLTNTDKQEHNTNQIKYSESKTS